MCSVELESKVAPLMIWTIWCSVWVRGLEGPSGNVWNTDFPKKAPQARSHIPTLSIWPHQFCRLLWGYGVTPRSTSLLNSCNMILRLFWDSEGKANKLQAIHHRAACCASMGTMFRIHIKKPDVVAVRVSPALRRQRQVNRRGSMASQPRILVRF